MKIVTLKAKVAKLINILTTEMTILLAKKAVVVMVKENNRVNNFAITP